MFEEARQKLLQLGAVGIMPTDTVYGLVARAEDEEAVERIYKLKQRESKPGTIIAANIEQLVGLGLKYRYLKAVEQFWPGAVSVKIPYSGDKKYLKLGQDNLAVRIPDFPELLKLMNHTGPLQTSSANLTGQPTVTNIQDAQKIFGNKVDFYIDGGDLSDRKPSTVIKIIDDAIEVVRQGSVKIKNNGVQDDI